MIDAYLVSEDEAALAAFCASFKDVIGPVRGRSATEAFTDEYGTVAPAREAVGDPSKFYTCVRTEAALMLPAGVAFCETETGIALCGVWA